MKLMIVIALIAVAFLAVYIVGCSPKANVFGQPISETTVTSIGDIFKRAEQFQGKRVRIEGKITDECPAGGWFFLQDQTGTIYVNLHPSEFAIPQVRGQQVIAQGVVRREGTQIEVIGEGVQIK